MTYHIFQSLLTLQSQYALVNFFKLYRSGHGLIAMLFFHIQAIVRVVIDLKHDYVT